MNHYEMDLMLELQATSFALLDIQLYLDSHLGDPDALQDYATLNRRMRTLRKAYEQQIGPLSGYGDDRVVDRAGWVDQPWPWETT